MKRILSLILTLVLIVGTFSACGNNANKYFVDDYNDFMSQNQGSEQVNTHDREHRGRFWRKLKKYPCKSLAVARVLCLIRCSYFSLAINIKLMLMPIKSKAK